MNTVLAVDDEAFNLEIIEDYLSSVDIETVGVDRGDEALDVLQKFPDRFSAILLDRMMPGIDGMEVLSTIKSDENLSHIPVIMQTAKTGKKNTLEGLNAGAHYYVSKPYEKNTLVTIVSTAIRDYQHYIESQCSLKQSALTLTLMEKGMFRFKSLSEARSLASILANACPNSDDVILGLSELMINAVEHGNLGIGYNEKSRLNASNEWEAEIKRRSTLQSNKDKYVSVEFNRSDNDITFSISDQGNGFDWAQYMEMSPHRVFDSHGRGIAMANLISFDQIKYLGTGNKVCVTVKF